jgi:hypothetical protein
MRVLTAGSSALKLRGVLRESADTFAKYASQVRGGQW